MRLLMSVYDREILIFFKASKRYRDMKIETLIKLYIVFLMRFSHLKT